MKKLKNGRWVGFSVGAGMAIAAVYSFSAYSSTASFQPLAGEFHTISEFESIDKFSDSLAKGPDTSPATNSPLVHLSNFESKTVDSMTTQKPTVVKQVNFGSPGLYGQVENSKVQTAGEQSILSLNDELLLELETPSSNSEFDLFQGPDKTEKSTTWESKNIRTKATQAAVELDAGTFRMSPAQLIALGTDSGPNSTSKTESLAIVRTIDSCLLSTPSALEGTSLKWKRNPHLENVALLADSNTSPAPPKHEALANNVKTKKPNQTASVLSLVKDETAASNTQFEAPNKVKTSPFAETAGLSVDKVVANPIQFSSNKLVSEPVNVPALPDLSTQPLQASDPYSITPLDLALTESVAQRAVQHIEYGKSLARRGASFAARQEFYSALRVVAQAHDGKTGINEFSLSLKRGIMALKEAEDFMVNDTETQMGMNVGLAAETHRSKVLSKEEASLLTPIEAMQRYFAVAQQELERAVGRNVVSTEALYCLGKLHSVESSSDPTSGGLDTAKAIVYHRTALASDEKNYRSAHELGVLMARTGHLAEARDLLKTSLRINPAPQTWENLAKVHERLNEPQMAQLALAEYSHSLQMNARGDIQWKPASQFNADAPLEFHEAVAAKPTTLESATENEAKNSNGDEKPKSFSKMLKDLF